MRQLAILVLLTATPAAAATHAQIQNTVDTFWAAHGAKFVGVQTDYATGHRGRFWQGIRTHTILPDDGQLLNPDLTRKPTDQAERWLDVFIGGRALPSTNWPAGLTVDVYDGPSGVGWVATVCYTKAGETWCRSLNSGPETWRGTLWGRVQ